jgi:hypothetical protein
MIGPIWTAVPVAIYQARIASTLCLPARGGGYPQRDVPPLMRPFIRYAPARG